MLARDRNGMGRHGQAQSVVKSLKRTKNVVDEIISGMMAANETLDEDAQALKSTRCTYGLRLHGKGR